MDHSWFQRFGLICCKQCGIVRRADDKNKPCPGPVRLGLRNRIGGDRFAGRAALEPTEPKGGE